MWPDMRDSCGMWMCMCLCTQALLERAPAHGLLHVVAAWRNALHSTLNPDAHAPVFLDPLPRAATGSRGVVVM